MNPDLQGQFMQKQVVAISFDALSPVLLEMQVAAGRMPNFARLMADGVYGHLRKAPMHLHENSWSAFLVGASPQRTGEWGHLSYDPGNYGFRELSDYPNIYAPPFYCLEPKPRVAVFDIPITRVEPAADGIQLFGWSIESNQFLRQASDPALLEEFGTRYGDHPVFGVLETRKLANADGSMVYSYRNPSLYDLPALLAASRALIAGMAQRSRIIGDLLRREPWDLLLATYGEIHTIGHLVWHLGMPHPLRDAYQKSLAGAQPLQDALDAVDREVGALMAMLPEHATLVLFSVYGMNAINSDMAQMLFLPEFLYRWQFGEAALASGDPAAPVPDPCIDYRRHWKTEVWALRTAAGERDLESPEALAARGDPIDWNPTRWYQSLWPRMKAFSLPAYYNGLVRLNVRGREGAGVVDARDYGRECDSLAEALLGMVDARSGRPMISKVERMRHDPFDEAGHCPADLVVHWAAIPPVDTVQAPGIGRIGPVPYFRSGGHAPSGFCVMRGPGITPGSRLPADAQVVDLPATLLELMGRKIPAHMEGRSLFRSG